MVIEFSGWVEADPDKTFFQYIGPEPYGLMSTGNLITGTQYMTLDEHEQDNYILECLGQAYEYSLDGELNDLHIEIEEPI
jgi:hypothetical protein